MQTNNVLALYKFPFKILLRALKASVVVTSTLHWVTFPLKNTQYFQSAVILPYPLSDYISKPFHTKISIHHHQCCTTFVRPGNLSGLVIEYRTHNFQVVVQTPRGSFASNLEHVANQMCIQEAN